MSQVNRVAITVKTFWSVLGIAFLVACWPGIAIPQGVLSKQLDELLRKHEAQLARLSTVQADWSVTHLNDAEDPVRLEHWQTTITPQYERAKRLGSGSEIPDQYLWNGSSFRRMLEFDPEEYLTDPTSITAVKGYLYHEDLTVHRLFQWRTLRAYRLYADDADQSLRELCEQSPREPELSRVNGLVRIQLAHPGSPASGQVGTAGVPRGASILVEVDPTKGCLVRRYRTTFPLKNGGRFSQELSAQSFKEFPASVFLPTRVNYSATSGKHVIQQEMAFEFSGVNQAAETKEPLFVENLLVTEFESYGDPDAEGFYVVQPDRSLGEQFPSETAASLVRYHRMIDSGGSFATGTKPLLAILGVGVAAILWILLYRRRSRVRYLLPLGSLAGAAVLLWGGLDRDETVKSQISKLSSAPNVGDVAPPVKAVNLRNGKSEEMEFLGHVTLLEFWATWCGPCQHTMEELNKLASEKADQWEDRVQLVTISVDADHEAAEMHLRERGWLRTRTLVDKAVSDSSPQDVGFPSVVAQDYLVTGVPTCILVDDRGDIVFRGNPTSVDLAEKIEQLLED